MTEQQEADPSERLPGKQRTPIIRSSNMTLFFMKKLVFTCLVVLILAQLGCSMTRDTQPPRTATEQMLIGQAVVVAVEQHDFQPLADRQVHLDTQYLDRVDQGFLVGEVRAAILRAGGRLSESASGAEVIFELRSPGIGIDQTHSLLGLPAIPIFLPGFGGMETPEIAIYKREWQQGAAGVAFIAYEKATGKALIIADPRYGLSRMDDESLLAIPIRRDRINLPDYMDEVQQGGNPGGLTPATTSPRPVEPIEVETQ